MLEDQAMNEQRNALKASEDIKEASKDIKEETRKRKLPSESQGSKRRHVDKTIDDDVIIVDDHDEQPDKKQLSSSSPASNAAQGSSSSSQPSRGLPAKAVQEVVRRSGGVLSSDQLLKCETCKQSFLFTVSDHQRLIDRGITSIPSRCKTCRASSAPSKQDRGGQGDRTKAKVEEAIKKKYLEGSKSAVDKIKAVTAKEMSTSSLWRERAKGLERSGKGSSTSGAIKGLPSIPKRKQAERD